jgi:hypothetical protein
MAISSGRKKPDAYDGCHYRDDFYESWNESWKKFNDLSSKTVIYNTFLPVFLPYWLDSDDRTES